MLDKKEKGGARPDQAPFWAVEPADLLDRLQTPPDGLSDEAAAECLQAYGPNWIEPRSRRGLPRLLLSQFGSPIVLILLFAAGLSFFLGEPVDAAIILAIVLASGLLGFWQEKGAADAVEGLLAVVRVHATVLRNGRERELPPEEVVPGDVVVLSAGDSLPADCRILSSDDLHADEATLTGETYPVEKEPATLPSGTPLAKRTKALFMGTHIVSGTAKAVVVRTGKETEFGKVSERLSLRTPETEFERGLRHFGYLLVRLTFLLVLIIFAVNVYFQRPVLDSFLFSLALAVGLTPQPESHYLTHLPDFPWHRRRGFSSRAPRNARRRRCQPSSVCLKRVDQDIGRCCSLFEEFACLFRQRDDSIDAVRHDRARAALQQWIPGRTRVEYRSPTLVPSYSPHYVCVAIGQYPSSTLP